MLDVGYWILDYDDFVRQQQTLFDNGEHNQFHSSK